MKNLLVLFFMMAVTFQVTGQNKEKHREKIKALKTAYITEGLNLTPQEAQKFWPVYNDFEKKRRALYRREHADIQSIECYTEEKAKNKLQEYVDIEREDYLIKKKFYEDLRKILPATRILQLKKVEDEFNRKLLKEYRARQNKEDRSS